MNKCPPAPAPEAPEGGVRGGGGGGELFNHCGGLVTSHAACGSMDLIAPVQGVLQNHPISWMGLRISGEPLHVARRRSSKKAQPQSVGVEGRDQEEEGCAKVLFAAFDACEANTRSAICLCWSHQP